MDRSLDEMLVVRARFGEAWQVAALLERGALPNAVDSEGTTAVYAASMQEDATIVRLLLAAGGDPNLESVGESDGMPLCGAAACGFGDVVRELLAHGADPNQREDASGRSPLVWASGNGHDQVVRMLLEAGADPGAAGADGRTPLAVAESWVGRDVEAELRAYGPAEDGAAIRVSRTPRPGGTELVTVAVESMQTGGFHYEKETGHARIAELLRERGGPDPR